MENPKEIQSEDQEFKPDMLWEGFLYLAFFVFFCIYLIPNSPKSLSFNRYYPIALITYGFAGVMTGRLFYVLTKRLPAKAMKLIRIAAVVAIYSLILFYLVSHVNKFSMH